MSPCRSRRTKKLMGVPEQRYHAWMSVQLLIIVVIRRFDHGVLLIIRSQSDDRGRKLLLITRVLSLDEFSVPLLLATLDVPDWRVAQHPACVSGASVVTPQAVAITARSRHTDTSRRSIVTTMLIRTREAWLQAQASRVVCAGFAYPAVTDAAAAVAGTVPASTTVGAASGVNASCAERPRRLNPFSAAILYSSVSVG